MHALNDVDDDSEYQPIEPEGNKPDADGYNKEA
jgi:hypothetical protein